MGLLSDSLKKMRQNSNINNKSIENSDVVESTKEVYRKYVLNNGKVLLLNESDFWSSIQYNIIESAPLYRSLVLLPLNIIEDENFGFDCNLKFNNIGKNFYKQPFQDAIFKVLREYTHIALGHKVKCDLVFDPKDTDIEYHKRIFNMQRYLLDNIISNAILINNPELVGVSKKLIKPSPGFLESMTNFQCILNNKVISERYLINSWVNVDEKSCLSILADCDKKFYDKKMGDYKVNLGLCYELEYKGAFVVGRTDSLKRCSTMPYTVPIFIAKKYLEQIKRSLHLDDINEDGKTTEDNKNNSKMEYDDSLNSDKFDINSEDNSNFDNDDDFDSDFDNNDGGVLNSGANDGDNLDFDSNNNQDILLDRDEVTEEIENGSNEYNSDSFYNQGDNQSSFGAENGFSDMINSLQSLSFDNTQSKNMNDILNQTKQELLNDMMNQNTISGNQSNNQIDGNGYNLNSGLNNSYSGRDDIPMDFDKNQHINSVNNGFNSNEEQDSLDIDNNSNIDNSLNHEDISIKKMRDTVDDFNNYLEDVKDECENMWNTLLDKISNVCMNKLKQDLSRNELKVDRNNILDAMIYIYNQYKGNKPIDKNKSYVYDVRFKEAIGKKLEEVMTDYFARKQFIENIDTVDGMEILQYVDYTDIPKNFADELDECLSLQDNNYESASMSLSDYKDMLTVMKAGLNNEFGFSTTGSGSLIYKKYTNLYKTTDVWYKSAEEMIKSYGPKGQYSFQRLNKKYQSLGITLPSKCKRSKDSNIDNLSVFIDSSASMSDKDYIIFESIIQNSSKLFPKETRAFEFNTSLSELKVSHGRILEKPSTTGGTNIKCVLNKFSANELKKTLNIVVSDGMFDWSEVYKFMNDNVLSKYMFIVTNTRVDSDSVVNKLRKEINNKRLRIITVTDVDKDKGSIIWGKS